MSVSDPLILYPSDGHSSQQTPMFLVSYGRSAPVDISETHRRAPRDGGRLVVSILAQVLLQLGSVRDATQASIHGSFGNRRPLFAYLSSHPRNRRTQLTALEQYPARSPFLNLIPLTQR